MPRFYEWLKKSPSEKVPHFVKRKDGQLMCFAGLWDSVTYENQPQQQQSPSQGKYDEGEEQEDHHSTKKKHGAYGPEPGKPLHTYTIVTTNSNKQLNFVRTLLILSILIGFKDQGCM